MEKKKVLVVDDEPAFTQLISEYFKSLGYEIYAAHNLEDAINLFRRYRPKVVLLDFKMPLVTGEKFLPILQDADPMVRVIVITGCLGEDVEEKFKGMGYFSYFEKGTLSLDKLRENIDEAMSY